MIWCAILLFIGSAVVMYLILDHAYPESKKEETFEIKTLQLTMNEALNYSERLVSDWSLGNRWPYCAQCRDLALPTQGFYKTKGYRTLSCSCPYEVEVMDRKLAWGPLHWYLVDDWSQIEYKNKNNITYRL